MIEAYPYDPKQYLSKQVYSVAVHVGKIYAFMHMQLDIRGQENGAGNGLGMKLTGNRWQCCHRSE